MRSDDVQSILASLGIERHRIVPTNVSQKILRQKSEFNQFDGDISYFPLAWFDIGADNDNDNGCSPHFSVCREGFAFLPSSTSASSSSSSSKQIHSTDYEWRKVSIRQYNNKSNRWLIGDGSGSSYEVPRIYLMFLVEDAAKFAARIQRAVRERDNCERALRFEALLNAFPMHRIPLPPVRHRERIQKMLPLHGAADVMEFYQRECVIVYQKALAAQRLIKLFSTPATVDDAHRIELPGRVGCLAVGGELKNLTMECLHTAAAAVRCKESQRRIQQLWLYCCPQSIKIMEFINDECEHVSRLSLFHLQTSSVAPCCWEKFRHENISKLQSMSALLQTQWIDKVVNEIENRLVDVGREWTFDMRVYGTSWSMYRLSKLRRLVELAKQRMQAALILLLKSSLGDFVDHLCRPCKCLLHLSDDFEWNADNLRDSPFRTLTPLFHVQLNFHAATVEYSIFELEQGRVEEQIVEMFEQCVLTTHQIPQIDPYLLKRLRFDVKHLKLASIGLLDTEIRNQIAHLRRCYSKCLIPLCAYARQYHKFIELGSLNVAQYIQQKFIDTNSTAHDIQSEIRSQMRACNDIRASVPESLVIGPFLVDTAQLKASLVDKRGELVSHLKRLLLAMASERVDDIQRRYDAIMVRLSEKPKTIEHLDDIAKWIPSVAQRVEELSNEMSAALTADFKCIESFSLALPDETFAAKWRALRMPQIVSRQTNETLRQHEYDVERFRKMQASDETVFAEKIDEIAREVDECTQRCSFDDYFAVCEDVEGVWSKLQAALERGRLLNRRCEILNQPQIDAEPLSEAEQRLAANHRFWTATSNFLSSKATWTERVPLSAFDVPSTEAEMRQYRTIVEASRAHFADNADMTGAVERASDEMREMETFIDIIKDIKNPDLRAEHWERLRERVGIKFEFDAAATTFGNLMMRGILRFAAAVSTVSCEASEEATREREEQRRMALEEEARRQHEEAERQRKRLRRLARTYIFN